MWTMGECCCCCSPLLSPLSFGCSSALSLFSYSSATHRVRQRTTADGTQHSEKQKNRTGGREVSSDNDSAATAPFLHSPHLLSSLIRVRCRHVAAFVVVVPLTAPVGYGERAADRR